MYISVVDYLKEVKSKFYIIIAFFIIFVGISYAFNIYKSKILDIQVSVNLLEILSVSISGNNAALNLQHTNQWIKSRAEKNFQLITKETYSSTNDNWDSPGMACESNQYIVSCRVQSTFGKGDRDKFKKQMSEVIIGSINSSVEDFKNHGLITVNNIIYMNEGFYENILNSYEETYEFIEKNPELLDEYIQTKSEESKNVAIMKEKLEKSLIYKNLFIKAVENTKVSVNDVNFREHRSSFNYTLIIFSSVICGLFAIFLQMKVK